MATLPSTKLEVAKEIMLKAMESMRLNFGTDLLPEEFNQRYAQEIDKLFKSIYQTISEADEGLEPRIHQL